MPARFNKTPLPLVSLKVLPRAGPGQSWHSSLQNMTCSGISHWSKFFLAVRYLWTYWTDFRVWTLKMKVFPSSRDLLTEFFSDYFPKIIFSDDYAWPSSSKTAKINENTRNHQNSCISTVRVFHNRLKISFLKNHLKIFRWPNRENSGKPSFWGSKL